ncbi:MAG TPA: AEC family transporter, partial [Tepidisphaeraceae bacterium]|nr:AEC family transporter [Tepidisphaeraceae bacterium]
PLPIAEQLFPSAVSTLMIFNVGVEIAVWTIGVMVLTGGTTSWPGALKRIINPPLMSIVAALVVRGLVRSEFLPVDVSSALAPTVHHLMNAVKIVGDCGVPMGLILSGAIMLELLREADWRFGWKPFGVAAGLRLLVLPAIMLVIARFAPIDVDLKRVLLLQAAMPSASFSIVLVRLYGQDAQVALKIVVGTTLLALFTIPIWLIVGRTWLGV